MFYWRYRLQFAWHSSNMLPLTQWHCVPFFYGLLQQGIIAPLMIWDGWFHTSIVFLFIRNQPMNSTFNLCCSSPDLGRTDQILRTEHEHQGYSYGDQWTKFCWCKTLVASKYSKLQTQNKYKSLPLDKQQLTNIPRLRKAHCTQSYT